MALYELIEEERLEKSRMKLQEVSMQERRYLCSFYFIFLVYQLYLSIQRFERNATTETGILYAIPISSEFALAGGHHSFVGIEKTQRIFLFLFFFLSFTHAPRWWNEFS
jgi:hypothetical protein